MAKFVYKMQNILNIKMRLETQAKTEFSQASARLDEEEDKLRSPGFMMNSAAISAIIARPAVSSRILFAVMRLPPVNCSSVSVRIFTAKPILCKTAIIIA